MPRKRTTVTATKTTTVTESVTATETIDDTGPIATAPGWADLPRLSAHDWREQREGQVDRCLDFLWLWAESSEPAAQPQESLVRDAVTILRAGPAATPLELTLGRSI